MVLHLIIVLDIVQKLQKMLRKMHKKSQINCYIDICMLVELYSVKKLINISVNFQRIYFSNISNMFCRESAKTKNQHMTTKPSKHRLLYQHMLFFQQ